MLLRHQWVKTEVPRTSILLTALPQKNVELTIEAIKSNSEVLSEMLSNGEIDIVGAMYDVGSGRVSFLDQAS